MLRCVICVSVQMIIPAVSLIALTGCGNRTNGLPTSVTLTLPDGSVVEGVTQGSGAASLKNSTWEFSNAQGVAFVTITFGPNGELERFENNTIAQEIIGSTLIFDGQRHDTGIPLLQYAAATFGAETTTMTGFTFEGQITAFAPVFGQVGSGMANATGQLDPNDPDRMTGDFSFSFTVSPNLPIDIPVSPEDLTGEFSFTANRL